MYTLVANIALSAVGAYLSVRMIKEFFPIFIQRNLFGRDQCKSSGEKVPEPMGVITAGVYLIVMFLFIPIPFYGWIGDTDPAFPYHNFVEFLSALISICCMIFLGFADDVLDLRWRHKLLFPTLASLPLLMVYAVNFQSTTIIVPKQLRFLFGLDLNIGLFYYVYMGCVAVFCTNAINILAGINGLEAGQSLIVAASIAVFNGVQLLRLETQAWYHLFSLYFLLPYIATTAVLLYYNWYPSKVFVGDTFCYFSGMTFAVVGILGHFSKTLMLFFIPQIANFLYSLPQLFRLIPCPRHRLPKYDPKSDVLRTSVSRFKPEELKPIGRILLGVLEKLRLLQVERDGEMMQCNNMTIINLVLKFCGPMHERSLTCILLGIQVICSLAAFFIRFFMAGLLFDQVH